MKLNYLSVALLLVVFAIPLALADGYEDVPAKDVYNGKERRYGHLEYVGFYGSALRHWNFTEQLADVTNLTWIELGKIEDIVVRVREAKEAGVKAIVSLQPLVFDADYLVKPDYLATLTELSNRLAEENLTKFIAMVYPVDEPFLHATSSPVTNRKKMYRELVTITREVRTLFPGIPQGVIFNNKEVIRDDFRIPPAYRWVGFDCYENMFDCKGDPFTDYYSTLLEHMTHKQSLMAVPQTWVKYSDYERKIYEPRDLWESRIEDMARDLQKRLQHHYEIALSEPRFIAFIPFIWSMEAAPGKPEHSGFGADRFAEQFPEDGAPFVDYLLQITEEIKTGEIVYPNLSRGQTESSSKKPPNQYVGEILGISADGIVSAWGLNSALPHKNLRMQVILERGGVELYASRLPRGTVLDRSITDSNNNPVIGIHGLRHVLPSEIVEQYAGKSVLLKVRMFNDQAPISKYYEMKLWTRF